MSNGLTIVKFFAILTLLVCVQLAFAVTTGKIAGRILDKDTGEPLPGVNVIVEDTPLGAATDRANRPRGFFIISGDDCGGRNYCCR